MKAVHSFKSCSIKPYLESTGGAAVIKPLIQIMALSAATIRNQFDDFILITDDAGKDMAEACKMPYTEIISVGPSFGSDPSFWIHSKIYAYYTLKEPFVHLDTDLFLWEPLPKEYLASEVFALHAESGRWPDYQKYCSNLEEAGYLLPKLHSKYTHNNMPINMGIFGGNNYKAINQYAGFILEFVEDRKGFLDTSSHQKHILDANISFIEQMWVSYLIQDAAQIPITLLLPEDPIFKAVDVPGVKLTHLQGVKQMSMQRGKSRELMLKVGGKLKIVNPEVYLAVEQYTAQVVDIDSMIQEAKSNG